MDHKPDEVVEIQTPMLKEKIASLKEALAELDALEPELNKSEDKQISLTDPEARSLRTRGTGIVGYNVQTAVEPDNHLIVGHAMTNQFNDHRQLSPMAIAAKEALDVDELDALADRGYYKGEEVLACEEAGIDTYVPRPMTSNNKAKGLYDKADFHYNAERDEYRCAAGDRLPYRMKRFEGGKWIHRYWCSNCKSCALKPKCTTGKERRVSRWEHEHTLDAMHERLDRHPNMMRLRRDTVEHPFGTLKRWMGAEHFLTKGLHNTGTEMSLHVLAYNMKRVMNILRCRCALRGAIRAFCSSVFRFSGFDIAIVATTACLARPSSEIRTRADDMAERFLAAVTDQGRR